MLYISYSMVLHTALMDFLYYINLIISLYRGYLYCVLYLEGLYWRFHCSRGKHLMVEDNMHTCNVNVYR